MSALKRFLGVGQMTATNIIYGDTGRYPLYINSYVHTRQYWLKITRMNEKCLPYKACLMLLHLDEQGKGNWVIKIRTTLFRFGFGYVWQNKGVQEVNLFIRCFRQRLVDNRWRDWKSRIDAINCYNSIYTCDYSFDHFETISLPFVEARGQSN